MIKNTRRDFLAEVGLSAAAFTAISADIEALNAATEAKTSIDSEGTCSRQNSLENDSK